MIGSQDLMVGLVIALFFFGAKKLPELAGSIGKSMKEFKKGVAGEGSNEEETSTIKPLGPSAPEGATHRVCACCHAPLEATWGHCPRCGTVIASSSAGASGS